MSSHAHSVASPNETSLTESATTWHHFSEEGFPDPLLDLIAERFRLLSEPLRLKLLAVLGQGERNVGELVALTGAGQPNVSKHLNALAQGGLVQRRKVGTSIRYAVADSTIFTLCNVVCEGVQERLQTQAHLVARTSQATVVAHQEPGD